MRAGCWKLVGVCLFFAVVLLRADEQADAKAIVGRALTAMGGADKVARFSTAAFKCKITHEHNGQQLQIGGDGVWQGLERIRFNAEFDHGGQPRKLVVIINGDMGWEKKGEQSREAPEPLIRTLKSAFYTMQMLYLLPSLKDQAFTVSLQGEQKLDDRAAVGLTVNHSSHQPVTVLFDKESGLPVKSESRITDPNGKEILVEFFYRDYQETDGSKRPWKIFVKGDGNEFHIELTELVAKEKIDDSEFARP